MKARSGLGEGGDRTQPRGRTGDLPAAQYQAGRHSASLLEQPANRLVGAIEDLHVVQQERQARLEHRPQACLQLSQVGLGQIQRDEVRFWMMGSQQAQQRRLAVAGRRANKDMAGLERGLQPAQQMRPRDERWSWVLQGVGSG